MPPREGGEEDDVQQRDAGRVERVRGPCITTGPLQLAEDQTDDAREDADRELERWRQPTVLHRVADKEATGQKERERRDDREELHAD